MTLYVSRVATIRVTPEHRPGGKTPQREYGKWLHIMIQPPASP